MTDPRFMLGKRVRAFAGNDRSRTMHVGEVIAYTDRPTFTIRTDDSKHVSWVADLCELDAEREPSLEKISIPTYISQVVPETAQRLAAVLPVSQELLDDTPPFDPFHRPTPEERAAADQKRRDRHAVNTRRWVDALALLPRGDEEIDRLAGRVAAILVEHRPTEHGLCSGQHDELWPCREWLIAAGEES